MEARLSVHNACDHVVILAYEWQGITLELHDDPERDRRVWAADRRFRPDIPPGVPVTTPDVLESTRIPPGSSATPPQFTVSFPTRSILGDSLPGGTYYLALSFAGREMRNPGEPLTQINQPAGRLRLEMD